ncbi:MAG: zf-HC2 domain-containing protein [Solibacillus sp.]
MKDCYLVEDLWPLYEEGLVQPETKQWIEQHIQHCAHCQKLHDGLVEIIPIPKSKVNPEQTIAKATLKLHIYQLLLVVLSFIVAMNTSLLSNQGFQFILSYFVLGIAVYYFYKSWLLTVLIAFIPTAIWSIYDGIMSYGSMTKWWEQSLESYPSVWQIFSDQLVGALFVGVIHTLFTVLGIGFVVLIQKAFEKERTE